MLLRTYYATPSADLAYAATADVPMASSPADSPMMVCCYQPIMMLVATISLCSSYTMPGTDLA
eukprot:3467816-Rhodomonas_salina.2